jgi:PST family polysaccharide transporter
MTPLSTTRENNLASQREPALSKMVASSAALVVSKAGQVMVLLGALAVLARLLTPADFGAAALAMIVPEIVMTFHQFGMSPGLMREINPSKRLIRLCLLNCAWRNLWCAAAIVGAAALFALIYDSRALFGYGLIIAPFVFAGGVSGVHRGVLERDMRFGTIAGVQMAALVAGAGVAIVSALRFHTALPLILQSSADLAVRAGAMVFFARRAIRGLPDSADGDASAIREITRIGRDLTLSKIIRQCANRLDQVLVGYFAGQAALGLYSAARRWSFYLSQEVHVSMLNVAVASLSRSMDDAARFRASARSAQALSLFMAIPASAFLFLEAPAVIRLVFGDAWLGVVPLYRILLIAAAFRLPVLLTNQVFYSEGRTREQLRWTSLEAAAYALAVALSAAGGERAIAIAYTVTAVLMIPAGLYFAAHDSRARVSDFLLPWIWVMSISLVSMGVAWLVTSRLFDFRTAWMGTMASGLVFAAAAGALTGAFLLFSRIGGRALGITSTVDDDSSSAISGPI